MELQQLRAFLEVSRRRSFTAAAKALHRTQPAISSSIRGLERELGQRLFIRRRRGVVPTEVGLRLVRRVEDWLREMEGTVEEARIWGGLDRGPLRFGTTDVPAIHWLPTILRSFLRKHPDVRLTVNVEGSRTLVEQCLRGDVELALVTLPIGPEDEDLEIRSLHREPLIVVGSRNHALAGKRSVGPELLAREWLILHKPESVTRRTIEATFRTRGLIPRISMEISHPEAIKRLVRVGLGLSVLPESMVREDLRRGTLRKIGVRGWRLERHSGLVWPAWRPLTEVAKAWVEHLSDKVPAPRSTRRGSAS